MDAAVGATGRPTARATLIGRDGELAAMRAGFAAAAAGTPTVVYVEGQGGVGKTALVDAFLDDHTDVATATVEAGEHDGDIAFGLFDQLARALGREQRGVADDGLSDVVAAGAALVDRLGALDAPPGTAAIVALEDVHWADPSSLDAIAFAWRRLVNDRILLIITTREAPPDALDRVVARRGTIRLALGGLDAADVADLAARLGKPLTPELARTIVEHTGGLPLHVRTLLDDLTATQLVSATTLSLPAPRSFTATIDERLRHAPPDVVRLVETAAVWAAPAPLGFLAKLAGVDVDHAHDAATAAAELGVLRGPAPGDKTVAFTHPLLRAAVYHGLTPAHRHELHVRAAHAAPDDRTSLRHRLAASPGADDDLAAELAAWAVSQAREGSLGLATSAFLAAHRVATPGPQADDYRLRAAELMISSGNDVGAAAILDAVDAAVRSPRRLYLAGTTAVFRGDRVAGERLLLDAWDACGPDDGEVASHTASSLGALYVNQGRAKETVEWTRRALDLATPEDAAQALATTVHAISLAVLGRYREARELVDHLPNAVDRPSRRDDDALLARGILALWRGDLEAARADLDAIVAATRERGPAHAAVMGLYYLADAELRLGLWDDALRHGELAVSLANDAGLGWTSAIAHAAAAAPLTLRGEIDAATAHVDAARAAAARLADPAATLWCAVAAARLRVARGDADAAAELEPLWSLRAAPGLDQLGIQPWLPVFVDALLLADHGPLLRDALDELERRVAEDPQPGPLAVAARARATLLSAAGDHRQAADVVTGALADIDASALPPEPFEQALLQLALGMALRRAGRRRAAVDQLRGAHKSLVALEARPWLERCERELASCGLTRTETGARLRTRLTPQELAVAHLVAKGMTNREVATELIVSVKTVEYHLGNIYPKLGVRSRGGLAAALDRLG
jgi:ATP/maltotriose-dependent transcriptional regulator MalT